jgi:IS5 family transposase
MTDEDKKDLTRRQAIEPIIGHLKADHRMNRCHLKGSRGDSLHAVLCAAGYNIRWLLRMIVKKGISLFLPLLLSTGLVELGNRWRQFFMGPSVKSGSMNLVLV